MGWTPRERVLAALNHEEPDRVPIDFGTTYATSIVLDAYENLKNHLGVTRQTEFMSEREMLVFPDEEVLRRFDVDTRAVMPRDYTGGHQRDIDENSFVSEFNVTWKRSEGENVHHFINVDGPFYGIEPTIDAVESFDWPEAKYMGPLIGSLEAMTESSDYARILFVDGGVIHRGYSMRGFEQFLKDFYKYPEFVCRLMDKLADFWIGVTENAINIIGPENIDVVFFGEDMGTQDGCLFNPVIYAKYIKPRHRRMVESVKALTDAKICWHCCGSAYHFIDHLADIGVDALNPVQVGAKDMDPQRLKDEFGDRMSFWGGIDSQHVLPLGSPDEVRAETRRIIGILGKGGGYVLNSVHNLLFEVPPENVVAMFDVARSHSYARAARTQ